SCSGPGGAARRRCLDHADADLGQHQCAVDHDRREGRADDAGIDHSTRLIRNMNEGDVMAMRILWPNLPARLVPVATEAVGSGFELEFREKFEDVSDEQWAKADAVLRRFPPPSLPTPQACPTFL